jgi:hypothetical protein
MTRFKWLLCVLFLTTLFGRQARANTFTAASCNTSDVQSAINSASEGDTVLIPAGSCTWTSGVTISGKGIIVNGAGSARIIAIDNGTEMLTIATGTLTVDIGRYSPGFSATSITNGETLRVTQTGGCWGVTLGCLSSGIVVGDNNWMQGTVTSLVGSVLTMNITSDNIAPGGTNGGGSTSTHRWYISTVPATQTIISNGEPSTVNTPLFNVTEDTAFHTSIGNIRVVRGTTSIQHIITLAYASGGQAILVHDMWISGNPTLPTNSTGSNTMIELDTHRGVIWNCSFNSSPFNISTIAAVEIKDSSNASVNSWSTPSTFGSADTTGEGNLYVETNDFHAFGFATSTDDNGRLVSRYNLYDNSGYGTHGADSSPYGQRYFEVYNNTFVFNGYNDGTTFNMNNWFYVRGGTFVIHDNIIPEFASQDYGNKPDLNATVMNLQRGSGPDPCWGAGTSGGAHYHAPRQVGYGYVSGTGTAPNSGGETHDSITFVGDSEPGYIWNNSRSPLNVGLSDYGTTECTNPDTSANYIVLNRDYFNGSTAKPGYSPFTYPHPFTLGQSSGNQPPAPTNLMVVVQ